MSSVPANATGIIYSIPSVADATSYFWTIPSSASIVSGQGTTSIIVNFGNTGGDVTVVANNNCGSSPASVLPVMIGGQLTLNLKLFIEGYYMGGGMMDNFGNGGCLYVTGLSLNSVDADSIFVSLVDPVTLTEVDMTTSILHINGTANVIFSNTAIQGNSYYIKVKHRNAIETWSSIPVMMNLTATYDFTTSPSQAYGNNQVETYDHLGWAFYSGDISMSVFGVGYQDGVIESQDYSDMENAVNIILLGYVPEDITGDGVVESLDYSIIENNVIAIIFSIHP